MIPERRKSPDSTIALTDAKSPPPRPLCRLHLDNLSSKGAEQFLQCCDAVSILEHAMDIVLKILNPHLLSSDSPDVRSITLVLRAFDHIAYTTGKEIDFEHKEIHLSTRYIEHIDKSRLENEVLGVIVHDMVHCWQWNGQGECKVGLIKGIADWVRLQAGLASPRWKKRWEGNWDAGYSVTAYFLDWLERVYGAGTVPKLNQKLREKYVEEAYWPELFNGKTVKELWKAYGKSCAVKEA